VTGFDPGRLRWRLLAANLAVAAAGVVAVAAGVWLAAPRAFDDAVGHMGGSGTGMMGGAAGGMMDPLLRTAFGDAVGSAVLLGLAAAVVVAVVVAVLLATGIARPIDDLAAASRRVARGDYSRPVPATSGELGELAAAFNGMAATLQATEQRRRDLIGDVAHELRTPIASVRGYVEGLQAGVFVPGPDAWRVLEEQTARLAHLVDDLAVLWSAESRDIRLDIETLDGPALLADARERHVTAAAARSIDLAVAVETPASVRADRVRVAQVLDNLVGNALRYSAPGGHVTLALARDGAVAVLSVGDDGPGLTAEQAGRVFERFYRTDPSRSRDAGGSGLGLAITRSLVEAMGGSIAVTSAGIGRGATFTVRLPAG
jgi:two-component system, OmpR family, sensor histidine kinase BaeS